MPSVGILSTTQVLTHRLGGVKLLCVTRFGVMVSQDILTEAYWDLIMLRGVSSIASLRASVLIVWLSSLLLDSELIQYLRVSHQAVYALVLG